MDVSDGEVNDLLENYRLSHQSPSQYGALDTSRTFEAQFGSKSGDLAGNKRKMNGKPEQEQDQVCERKGGEEEAHTYKKENGEERDAGQRGLGSKRLKRQSVRPGEWQELETELDLAGEAMPAFPVSLQFATTDLPFRPKS